MIKLSDGTKITIDLSKITISEYRSLYDVEQSAEDGDAILGKACGLTGDEVGALSFPDYKAVNLELRSVALQPVSDEKN